MSLEILLMHDFFAGLASRHMLKRYVEKAVLLFSSQSRDFERLAEPGIGN